MISRPPLDCILSAYQLPFNGVHGLAHWARVLENGCRLAVANGANIQVVELFAVFHDSRRINDHVDRGYGWRCGELAQTLRNSHFDLSDNDFDLLFMACAKHTNGLTEGDITLQVCWDADRLDLYRVGIYPDQRSLCTKTAKEEQVIRWAVERSISRQNPSLVEEEWGIWF